MRIPPTPERLKEAPAQALRALFAGVGQVLLITERVRQRALGPQKAPDDPARDIIPPSPPAPPPPAPAEAAGEPAADISPPVPAPSPAEAAQEPAADISPPVPAPSPAEAAGDPAADITLPAAREDDEDDLPLAGYSGLSLASLRARLRGLDAGQVRTLLDYERAHENRENVTTMFERRLAKLEAGAG